MDIKTVDEAKRQMESLPEKVLIRIANFSTNPKIVEAFNCPFKYPIIKHKINTELA